MTESSYLTVELLSGQSWVVTHNDASWETKLKWARYGIDESVVTVEWTIEPSASPGTYRIQHFGYYKPFLGQPQPYNGVSDTFLVE